MSLMLLTFQLFRPLAGPFFFFFPFSHQPARPTTIYLAGLSSFILFYFIFLYICARVPILSPLSFVLFKILTAHSGIAPLCSFRVEYLPTLHIALGRGVTAGQQLQRVARR